MTKERKLYNLLVIFISTGAGSGYFPLIPGTIGSLVGVAIYLSLSYLCTYGYILILIALFALACWSAGEAEVIFRERDCQKIVIDEIFGYLVAMLFIPLSLRFIIFGFILFRFFDMVKFPPANIIDRKMSGGYGVVLDDVVAGIYSNLILQLIRLILR